MYRNYLTLFTALVVLAASSHVTAGKAYNYEDGTSFTYSDFEAWMKESQAAEPQFVDGDVITEAERHLTDPFLPPGLQMADMYGEPLTIKDAGLVVLDSRLRGNDNRGCRKNGGSTCHPRGGGLCPRG